LVIWQGMKLVVVGLAVGGLSGYFLKGLLASEAFITIALRGQTREQLYGVKGTDPLTFAVIGTLLLLVALAACWLPARKDRKSTRLNSSHTVISYAVFC